jgi:hypothetical protein
MAPSDAGRLTLPAAVTSQDLVPSEARRVRQKLSAGLTMAVMICSTSGKALRPVARPLGDRPRADSTTTVTRKPAKVSSRQQREPAREGAR